ncbi:Tripeptidyl aminopeptidase [Colletotrichum trifolii]|uniref:Tripeptidyl aminopeptidase n=1 Tax=Colletotrichum trifolii TaxID=5466 RepID=A0A4R8RUU2_COLTR|nr:Tripeptidyl aminopeptidase [Colletotrichum trifolii]
MKSFADIVPPTLRPQRPSWTKPIILALLIFALTTYNLTTRLRFNASNHPFPVYTSWIDIPPSPSLHWSRCSLPGMLSGQNYLCARLTVPMDYQKPLNQSTKVHIAAVLLPAPGHGLDTRIFSTSPLLLNPGGPGGVGTAFTYPPRGPALQAMVGGDVDIIGFDPRGIGNTVPRADCYVDAEPGTEPSTEALNLATLHRLTWIASSHDVGLPNTTSGALGTLQQRAKAVSKLCERKDGEQGGFRYMSTPNVAADMKRIVETHDDWLEENGFLTVPLGASLRSPSESTPPPTKRKLVYWGFSYGTLLGQTFAAMYPNSVGRLVLDGVVDSKVYSKPSWWTSSIQDADAIVQKFFLYCLLAKDKCALHRQGDAGPDAIQKRYEHVLSALRAEPLVVISNSNMPVLLLEEDVKKTIFVALYAPMQFFPIIASLFNALYTNTDVVDFVIAPDFGPACSPGFKSPIYLEESNAAIGCSDQRVKRNETLEALFDKLARSSSSFADVFLSIMLSCEGWNIEAKFPSPDWDASFESGDPINTSFPILFAGNTYDPVTPLSAAVEMSQNFVHAGVFELEAEGHSTIAAVSFCAIRKIRDYLHKGIVPPRPAVLADGTLSGWDKCKSDEQPWRPFEVGAAMHAEGLHSLQAFRDVHAEIINPLTPSSKLRLNGNS